MPTSFPFLKRPSPSLPLYCICLWCSFPSSVCLTFQVYTPISLPPRGFTSHWLCLSTVFFLQSMDHGWHTSYLLVTHMVFLLMRTARGLCCLTYPHICNTALYLAHWELSVHIYLVNEWINRWLNKSWLTSPFHRALIKPLGEYDIQVQSF